MRRGGLKVRLLVTLLVLIVSLQLATSYVVLERTRDEGEARAEAALASGGRVFSRLLRDRERQLLSNVGVLVQDFGLRRAVATGDRPTVESALENHASRIRADFAFYIDLEGRIQAKVPTSADLDSTEASFAELFGRAEADGRASGIGLVDEVTHQIVLAPVKAPRTIGWIGMGFELDVALASELRDLTGLEVSFWSRSGPQDDPELASTLPTSERAALAEALQSGMLSSALDGPVLLSDAGWITLLRPIGVDSGEHVGAVLQTSYADAMASFEEQRTELISFFAVGLAMALMAALWIAGRVTGPVAALARAAGAISSGDLHANVAVVDSGDEIGELARSFRLMQQAVAEREQRIVHEGLHDRLTGLPNRQAIELALAERFETGDAFAVAILDIKRLKDVNGNLGAGVGDALLVSTAARLRESPSVDWVGRLGGDEFLVMLEDADETRLIAVISDLASRLEEAREIRGMQVSVGFASGIARVPADAEDSESLMRRAEIALGVAKTSPDGVACYASGLEEAHQRRIGILIELEKALDEGGLELHYQPKVDCHTGRAIGAEALIRWTHPRMGRMNPEEFIGIAEQTGFIGRISEWVLEAAARQVFRWSSQGIDLRVSINLSAADLSDDTLPLRIRDVLARTGASASLLDIEVTESAVMENPDRAAQLLASIREQGVSVAIDDFGTGHSSLAQLKTLPSDELKIDQAFVRNLRAGTPDEVIVRTTIELAHCLGLKVVAEGVEDRIAWDILVRHGCDIAQGYWMGRPMPASELGVWLDRFEKDGLDV